MYFVVKTVLGEDWEDVLWQQFWVRTEKMFCSYVDSFQGFFPGPLCPEQRIGQDTWKIQQCFTFITDRKGSRLTYKPAWFQVRRTEDSTFWLVPVSGLGILFCRCVLDPQDWQVTPTCLSVSCAQISYLTPWAVALTLLPLHWDLGPSALFTVSIK